MMMNASRRKRIWVVTGAALTGLFAVLAANAGKMLVVDAPQPSDVIIALAGETDYRPKRALDLLEQGYAPRAVIDVPAESNIYQFTEVQLAERYIQSLPHAGAVRVCPIRGLSTRDESHDVEQCLAGENGSRILLVTSEFHTRRALAIFRREIHGKSFSVAAAYNEAQFGTRWWTHREWAKTCFQEWLRWFWWISVDRWR
jgi:hypothetical protein